MKTVQIMLLIIATTMLWGCNFGCEVETVISEKLASSIAANLQCANVTQIQTDVTNIINVTKFCAIKDTKAAKNLKSGTVANIVCPFAASAAVNLLGSQIPAN